MSTTLYETPANQQRVKRAGVTLQDLLRDSLKQGFHGTARLEIAVQDGTIQHIRSSVERIER